MSRTSKEAKGVSGAPRKGRRQPKAEHLAATHVVTLESLGEAAATGEARLREALRSYGVNATSAHLIAQAYGSRRKLDVAKIQFQMRKDVGTAAATRTAVEYLGLVDGWPVRADMKTKRNLRSRERDAKYGVGA